MAITPDKHTNTHVNCVKWGNNSITMPSECTSMPKEPFCNGKYCVDFDFDEATQHHTAPHSGILQLKLFQVDTCDEIFDKWYTVIVYTVYKFRKI